MNEDFITGLVTAGLLLTGLLSFLKSILGDVGDFVRYVKRWWRLL